MSICMYVCLFVCVSLSVCLSIDLQINNVTPVMELKDQLVGKKLSEQILK